MQAIARVNRVFKDKEGGLIVDYIGIASELKKAMSEYTERDNKNYGDMDINKVYNKFLEKLEVCRDLFHGFEYREKFFGESNLERSQVISDGVNFMQDLSREKEKKEFF